MQPTCLVPFIKVMLMKSPSATCHFLFYTLIFSSEKFYSDKFKFELVPKSEGSSVVPQYNICELLTVVSVAFVWEEMNPIISLWELFHKYNIF